MTGWRPTTADGSLSYGELVTAVRRLVEQETPAGAKVAVVSRGDDELIALGSREGWHFPRTPDGRYAGHHPADDAAAIRHLAILKARGVQFLLFPATAFWWLDHYPGFIGHLDRTARRVVKAQDVCFIYALDDRDQRVPELERGACGGLDADEGRATVESATWDEFFDDLRLLIDLDYYSQQCGVYFSSSDSAARHYVDHGGRLHHDPLPLFDSAWYVEQARGAPEARADPVLHFLASAAQSMLDPSPYFDTAYYYEQRPSLRESGVNALVHYVSQPAAEPTLEPNALFDAPFYYSLYPGARRSGRSPLADYLTAGAGNFRFASRAHQNLIEYLNRAGRSSLLRGNWKVASALFVTCDGPDDLLHEAAEELARKHHVEAVVISPGSSGTQLSPRTHRKVLDLEAFDLAFDARRPAVLRLLLRGLAQRGPVGAFCRGPHPLPPLRSLGIPTFEIGPGERPAPQALVDALLPRLRENVAVRSNRSRRDGTTRSIIIPCADWSVSGVNAALEAVGARLMSLGWDVEILFTRDKEYVKRSAAGGRHLPTIPYRFLARREGGVEEMWKSLIAEVEVAAPCVLLLGYDFLANSAIPALSDDVAVVMWLQADDADYYEQAYRLGRYANAIVCVSDCIRARIVDLNPGLARRSHVIHNSTVRREEVADPRTASPDVLSIVYAGRLVQYQKRILDFIDLAGALDRIGCRYTITLLGAFCEDETRKRFLDAASDHLQDGRISLPGRMSRDETFAELRRHAFFVLLSDFEGLPLAVVEAMATGCVPVIADMESGARELVVDGVNGAILSERDYDNWARTIVDLWQDQDRYLRLSDSARRTIETNFTIDDLGSRFHQLLADLAVETVAGGFRRPPALRWNESHAPFGDVLPPPSMTAAMDVEGLGTMVGGLHEGTTSPAANPLRALRRLRRLPLDHDSEPRRAAPPRTMTATHPLRDIRSVSRAVNIRSNLTALRSAPGHGTGPSLETAAPNTTCRTATRTHTLQDVRTLFDRQDDRSARGRRIRVCVVDTMLQTGGAEWFAAQLAWKANPTIFEFVFLTFNSSQSQIAKALTDRGYRVVCASTWRRNSLTYAQWLQDDLFLHLTRLRPDLVLFSSQYLFEQLRHDPRLAPFSVITRISNFHANELGTSDFHAAGKVICCTDEQYAAVAEHYSEKAVLIRTGVDLDIFRPPSPGEREGRKHKFGVEGKTTVLFVGRLGSPLKRVPVLQEVVRAVNATRDDVRFVVVGYFGRKQAAEEEAFQRFVDAEHVVWIKHAPPWEMPEVYEMADILLSTSAEYEGLSNTVLQALASGVVPVVTPSAGMQDLIVPGEIGFMAHDWEIAAIVRQLLRAVDVDATERQSMAEGGRQRVIDSFDLTECVISYQAEMLDLFRQRPAHVSITDGSFGIGGAEWLAALLILNADAAEVKFQLVVYRKGSPLVGWLEDRGVVVHAAPTPMTYDDWRETGIERVLRATRPDVVMPCTINTWPSHDPFYRLLVISQNAADAQVLQEAQYEQADVFLCVSDEVRDVLSSKHQEKMVVLRNSIDVEMFAPRPEWRSKIREQLSIRSDAKVILWCGRMHERRKRLDVLMDVIKTMATEPDVHFLVLGYFQAGDPKEDEWLFFLTRHPNVSWMRGVAPWETPGYYSAADLYLSTSGFTRADFEGLSLTSVQALAAELPIVTTASGGQREVVEHRVNGRLVATGDVRGLVEAIHEVLRTDVDGLHALRRRNRQKALERFDIRQHAQTYGAIARLLKNTVGPALASGSGLPTPHYTFRDEAPVSDDLRSRASQFLRYTWPLLPEVSVEPSAAVSGEEGARTISSGKEPSRLVLELREMERRMRSGEWLVIPQLRWVDPSGARHLPPPSAQVICDLLDYLDLRFAAWSACGRSGPNLVLRRA